MEFGIDTGRAFAASMAPPGDTCVKEGGTMCETTHERKDAGLEDEELSSEERSILYQSLYEKISEELERDKSSRKNQQQDSKVIMVIYIISSAAIIFLSTPLATKALGCKNTDYCFWAMLVIFVACLAGHHVLVRNLVKKLFVGTLEIIAGFTILYGGLFCVAMDFYALIHSKWLMFFGFLPFSIAYVVLINLLSSGYKDTEDPPCCTANALLFFIFWGQ